MSSAIKETCGTFKLQFTR